VSYPCGKPATSTPSARRDMNVGAKGHAYLASEIVRPRSLRSNRRPIWRAPVKATAATAISFRPVGFRITFQTGLNTQAARSYSPAIKCAQPILMNAMRRSGPNRMR
jgi:hypothetical protein